MPPIWIPTVVLCSYRKDVGLVLARIHYREFQDVRSCQEAIDQFPTSCLAVIVTQFAPVVPGFRLEIG